MIRMGARNKMEHEMWWGKDRGQKQPKKMNSSMCILIEKMGEHTGQREKEICLPRSAASSNYLKCQRQDLPFPSS